MQFLQTLSDVTATFFEPLRSKKYFKAAAKKSLRLVKRKKKEGRFVDGQNSFFPFFPEYIFFQKYE